MGKEYCENSAISVKNTKLQAFYLSASQKQR